MDAERGSRPRILVVDDAPDVCEMLAAWLGRSYEVVTVVDARSAHRVARQERPDLILLDILMPGQSGKTLAGQFRIDPFFTGVPIVYCTAVPSEVEGEPCLAKPFTGEQLDTVVKEALQGRSLTLADLLPGGGEAHGPRFTVAMPAFLEIPGQGSVTGQLVSLLLWGGAMVTPALHPPGTRARVTIADDGGIVPLGCEVVCAAEHQTGLRFRFETHKDERDYRELLARHGAPLYL